MESYMESMAVWNEVFNGPFAVYVSLFIIAILAITVISFWRIFKKAGLPGWAAIIPVYNLFATCKMLKISYWWILLIPAMYLPLIGWAVGLATNVFFSIRTSQVFNKGIPFAIGLMFLPLIFYVILAFDKSEYVGNIRKF